MGAGFSRPEAHRRGDLLNASHSSRRRHGFPRRCRTYEAVEDSACGICGNLERLAQPIVRHDGFGFVDNEIHYTARDRSTPRVIPSVQLHERSVGKSDTAAVRGTQCVDPIPTQWTLDSYDAIGRYS